MTNREAKERIKSLLSYMESLDADEEEEKDIEALRMAIKALEKTEWITVNSPDDYPKESGDYLTVLRNTSFHNHEYTDITSFDYDGILAEWDLKPQYKIVAWKYFEPYKGEPE